jgi:hypothetical protein
MRELRDQTLDITRFSLLGQVTIYCFLSVLFIMLILAGVSNNRGRCSYAVWHNIAFLTLIHWIPLINVDDNSEFQSFFEQIAIIFRPFRLPNVCLDESITMPIYNSMMIYSNGFINNAKEILLIYFTVLFTCISVLIMNKYSPSPGLDRMAKAIKYSIIIRLHLVFYLDFMTFSMINVYFFTGNNTCSSTNMGLSLFFLILGGCWIMAIPVIIKLKMVNDMENHHDTVFQSISTLVNEFKPCFQTTKYQYYTIFLLYRFSLAFSLVVLPNSPAVQLFIIATFQVIISNSYAVAYIGLAKPYAKRRDAITVFVAESLCLVLVVFIGIRSLNGISDNTKYYTSAMCVLLIWLAEISIIVRFALSIINLGQSSTQPEPAETITAVVPVAEQLSDNSSLKLPGKINNVSELPPINEKDSDLSDPIETYFPMEPYKYYQDAYNSRGLGSRRLDVTEIEEGPPPTGNRSEKKAVFNPAPSERSTKRERTLKNVTFAPGTATVQERKEEKVLTLGFNTLESYKPALRSRGNTEGKKEEIANESYSTSVRSRINTEVKRDESANESYNLSIRSRVNTEIKREESESYSPSTRSRVNTEGKRENMINTTEKYGKVEQKQNLIEELRIKDFLQKVNNLDLKVGNKGLGFQ